MRNQIFLYTTIDTGILGSAMEKWIQRGKNVQAFVDHWENSSKLSAGGEQKHEDTVGDSRADWLLPTIYL